MKKKRGSKKVIIVALIIITSILIIYGIFKNIIIEKVNLSPSQSTQVRVQVGNANPTITNIQAIPNVNLNPSPSTTPVIFTFIAKDVNGANDIVDSSASAQFTNTGEPTRSATCSYLSTLGKEKTYQCAVTMNYFDKSGTWNVIVSVADSKGATGQASSTFNINLLRDISITPSVINFPSVSTGDIDVISTDATTITNNGNFESPPGVISATAYDLVGEINSVEKIPAANFKITGSSQSDVCAQGITLRHSSSISLTNANLARGPSGSNTETLKYCLTSVPEISSQFYSASGGNSWVISIN